MNLYLEIYIISASLFVFRGSNTKLFSLIYLLYSCVKLRYDPKKATRLTSYTPFEWHYLSPRPSLVAHLETSSLDLTSWHLISERTCGLLMTTTLSHTGSGRTHEDLLPLWHLRSDLPCAHFDMHDDQGLYKAVICTWRLLFCSCLSFSPRLSHISRINLLYWIDSNRTSWIVATISSRKPLDGGYAAHWWSIPSDDRISLDLSPGGNHPLSTVMVADIDSA